MAAVDLNADLIPGMSAAGWRIGARLWECDELVRRAVEVEYAPGFDLNDAISLNAGVLVVRNYFPQGSGNTAVFFREDVVRFDFNAAGELFCIWAFAGYRGRAFGRVQIGSPLEEVLSLFPVFYDSGDEMYYPDREQSPNAPSGIAFAASQTEQADGTPVLSISIHDWELMHRPRLSR